jgi:hypothetical protein
MKRWDRVRITAPDFACRELEGEIVGLDVYCPGTYLVRIDGDDLSLELFGFEIEVIS